jgi:hypothetical protein
MHLQPPGPFGAAGPSRADGQAEGTHETETAMPDITLPEIHLPEVKLPDGLRDMSRQDIQSAISDRMPKKLEMPDVDLSKVDLPKAIEKRLPGRRRSNPILPIAAVLAIGSLFAAAWWLITSPTAMVRVREGVDRFRSRMGWTNMDEIDVDDRLDTLVSNAGDSRPSLENETWPNTTSELGDAVHAGNGSATSTPTSA